VLPHVVKCVCGGSPIARQRAKVVPQARGRVLELGLGSGLNLPYYDAARVEHVTGIDPSPELLRDAEPAARAAPFGVTLLDATAEALPAADASFDTVVVTYTLCSVTHLEQALAEARRVLRPGGELLFSEHGRAPDAGVQRAQRWLAPAWRRLGGGCQLYRAIPQALVDAGFTLASLDERYLPGPRFLNYHSWGVARP
jgi:ubiquinone/menaquinone biosynthesis C-methylase UbiE